MQRISFTLFLDFSMIYQIFLSPQVKQWAIITYQYGIYELPTKLTNNFSWFELALDPSKINCFEVFGNSKSFKLF